MNKKTLFMVSEYKKHWGSKCWTAENWKCLNANLMLFKIKIIAWSKNWTNPLTICMTSENEPNLYRVGTFLE
jgi:hypothetical protein